MFSQYIRATTTHNTLPGDICPGEKQHVLLYLMVFIKNVLTFKDVWNAVIITCMKPYIVIRGKLILLPTAKVLFMWNQNIYLFILFKINFFLVSLNKDLQNALMVSCNLQRWLLCVDMKQDLWTPVCKYTFKGLTLETKHIKEK